MLQTKVSLEAGDSEVGGLGEGVAGIWKYLLPVSSGPGITSWSHDKVKGASFLMAAFTRYPSRSKSLFAIVVL